jgi:hypothetical protein
MFTAVAERKPSSLPNHWPKSSEDEIQEKPKRLTNIGEEQTYFFCNNFVSLEIFDYIELKCRSYGILIDGLLCNFSILSREALSSSSLS